MNLQRVKRSENILSVNIFTSSKFMAEAYCVKCRKKKEIQGEKEVVIEGKGGTKRRALKGLCLDCGTKMFKFLKSK
jgi:hypothetical protein